jgi:hypothetical protein
MSDDQMLDALLQRQISVFTVSDERLRKLFIALMRRIRTR